MRSLNLMLLFSADSSRFASTSSETVQVSGGKGGPHIATLEGYSRLVASLAFSADGSRQGSASLDKTIRLWDVETRAHIACLECHSDAVFSVTFSANSSRNSRRNSSAVGWRIGRAHRYIGRQGHDHDILWVSHCLHRHLIMRCFGCGRAKADIS